MKKPKRTGLVQIRPRSSDQAGRVGRKSAWRPVPGGVEMTAALGLHPHTKPWNRRNSRSKTISRQRRLIARNEPFKSDATYTGKAVPIVTANGPANALTPVTDTGAKRVRGPIGAGQKVHNESSPYGTGMDVESRAQMNQSFADFMSTRS